MIDLHNDALLELPESKLLPYLRKAKTDGINEIWLSVWTTELSNPLKIIKRKKKILDKIKDDDRYPTCRLHIEDLGFITKDNIQNLIDLKPHSAGLTWNNKNNLAGGCMSNGKLTKFGKQVVSILEKNNIQIDTAHLNKKSFYSFAKITTRPMVCTHTAFTNIRRHKRNITNKQIKIIIKSGGKIGLCLVPKFLTSSTDCGFNDVIKHIYSFKKRFGTNNLFLGSDFFGTDTLPYGIKDYSDLIQLFEAIIIGYSALKQPLLCYYIGNPQAKKRILITGGMHAREWISSFAIKSLMHQHIKNPPNDTYIAFIPECNPDGIRLATQGLTDFFKKKKNFLLKINNYSNDFTLWKANSNAVDLNVNFDIYWGTGQSNITAPAPANYIGKHPCDQPENKALIKFIYNFMPTYSLAFHSKGELIYYSNPKDKNLALELSKQTTFPIQLSENSFGGLTDFLALKFGIPAFTLELGDDNLPHPITEQELPNIMNKIKNLIYFLSGA